MTHPEPTGDPGATGTSRVAEVDAVLADLEELGDRPVAEHVAGFESAHQRLRRALDDPHPDPEADPEADLQAGSGPGEDAGAAADDPA